YTVHLRQPEMAFASLARAVQASPADAALRAEARQAAEEADMVDSYAEALEELIEAGPGTARTALLKELADLYEKRLDDRVPAIAPLRTVLELVPGDLETLASLQRLHRAGQEWAALAEVLEATGRDAVDPELCARSWREAAQLHEQKLGDPESAAE